MIKRTSFGVICFSLTAMALVSACADSGSHTERKDGYTVVLETRQDSLFHEVMEGHNVAMAKMGKLAGYRKQAQQALDSLASAGKHANTTLATALQSLSEELKNADEGMNRWMEEFVVDSAENNEALRLVYLESEKEKVNKVKDEILSALQKADSLFSAK
ncbi:MAG: viral A-type inclusion protein [Chitinophagaceae bacterium]|nr:viral A-type inclusion protein [Chitinophagaceae bacterium]